jgi:hypothetical protein
MNLLMKSSKKTSLLMRSLNLEIETRRSSFSVVVCGGYGGVESDVDCRVGPG